MGKWAMYRRRGGGNIAQAEDVGDAAFVAPPPANNIRNDFTGGLGTRVVFNTNVTITQIARYNLAASIGAHTLEIRNNAGILLGSVVLPGGTYTANAWEFVTVPGGIPLLAGTAYNIMSTETSGGDSWRDGGAGDQVDSAEFAAVKTSVTSVSWNGSAFTPLGANESYGPVNFRFTVP